MSGASGITVNRNSWLSHADCHKSGRKRQDASRNKVSKILF